MKKPVVKQKSMAMDLHLGDIIQVAGVQGRVRRIGFNQMHGVVIVLEDQKAKKKLKKMKPGRKKWVAWKKAEFTVIVYRKQLLTVYPQ